MNEQVFKPYNESQQMLMPPNLAELIPERHLVRVINEKLKKRNITAFVKYNTFHCEQKRHYKKKKPYRADNFTHLPEKDQ
jgi:hypothetical protein